MAHVSRLCGVWLCVCSVARARCNLCVHSESCVVCTVRCAWRVAWCGAMLGGVVCWCAMSLKWFVIAVLVGVGCVVVFVCDGVRCGCQCVLVCAGLWC